MYKILIITTEGCDACITAEKNIHKAIAQTNLDIDVEVKDFHDFDIAFHKKYKIKDYPTTLYYIDDKVVNKAVGSYPQAVYLRWIDMYFKY